MGLLETAANTNNPYVGKLKETMTEEVIRIKKEASADEPPKEEITDCKLKTDLYIETPFNYWEGEHHFILLEKVVFVMKKYDNEIVVFLNEVPPQVYPTIKGEDNVKSFLELFRDYTTERGY